MGLTVARPPRLVQEFAVAEVAPHPERGASVVALIVAVALSMLVDGTSSASITAGLSYIAGRSAATPDESSWFVTAFNTPYYATILLSPWLYARFGRKPLLLAGLLGYAVFSALLVVTSSYEMTVALRFFQGLFLGCVFVPVVILLFTSLPLGGLRLAIPSFALIVLTAGAIGTLVGGYLCETYGEEALFIPGVLAALASAALVWRYAPHHDRPQPQLRFDVVGYTLSLLAFGAAQYLTNEGERRNWLDDGSVLAAFVILGCAVAGFLLWELYLSPRPHAKFRLFVTYRNLAVGSGINIFLGAVGYSVTILSFYLQNSIGDTITLAGEVIALRVLTYVAGIVLAFILVSQRLVDVRIVLISAALASAAALYGFAHSMTPTAEAATFIGVSLVFGLFFGMLSQPVPSLVIGALPLPDLPAGIAIYKLTAPIGLMAGTGFASWFVDHRAAFNAAELAPALNLSRSAVYPFAGSHVSTLAKLSALVIQQAQDLAYRDTMILMAVVLLFVIPLVLLVVPPTPRPPE